LTALKLGAAHSPATLNSSNQRTIAGNGLLVGTPVQLIRFAPMGDPVEIKVAVII